MLIKLDVIKLKTHQFSPLLPAERLKVVRLIPLPERCSVYYDNGILHQSLGSYQFIVGCIVYHINDTGLAGRA